MKKVIKLVALVALLAAAAGACAWAIAVARHYESTDNAYVKVDRVVVSPKVNGYVVAVDVQENQPVRAGEVLVRIDPADFEAKVAQERAAIASREAALEAMNRRVSQNVAEVAQAGYAVDAANAQAVKTLTDQQRDERLLKAGFASVHQSEVSRLNASIALSGESRARAQLEAARKGTSTLQAQAAQLRAEVQLARASLQLLELDLKNATITAPTGGVIGNKTVEVGQYVRAGSQLLTLVSDRKAYVVANFKETQMASLKPGLAVDVKVDAYPDLVIAGRIESFAPATGSEFSLLPPENATGNFTKIVQRVPVRIALDDSQPGVERLRSGMSVNVRVDTRAAFDAGTTTPARHDDVAARR